MKTDAEKFTELAHSLDLDIETFLYDNKMKFVVYLDDKYLCSVCFNLDGSLSPTEKNN